MPFDEPLVVDEVGVCCFFGNKCSKVVDFLIEEKRFEKILFPNRKYRSSLYKQIGAPYFAYLDDQGVKGKIQRKDNKKK